MHAKRKSRKRCKCRAAKKRASWRVRRRSYYVDTQQHGISVVDTQQRDMKHYLQSAVKTARCRKNNLVNIINNHNPENRDVPEQSSMFRIAEGIYGFITAEEANVGVINVMNNCYHFLTCGLTCEIRNTTMYPNRVFYMGHKTKQQIYILFDFFSSDGTNAQKVFLALLDVCHDKWIFKRDMTTLIAPYWNVGSQISKCNQYIYITGGIMRPDVITTWIITENNDLILLNELSLRPLRFFGHMQCVCENKSMLFIIGGGNEANVVSLIRFKLSSQTGMILSREVFRFHLHDTLLQYLLQNRNIIYVINDELIFLYSGRKILILNFRTRRIEYFVHTLIWSGIRFFFNDGDQHSLYEFSNTMYHKIQLTNIIPAIKLKLLWLAYHHGPLVILGEDVVFFISSFLTTSLMYDTGI